MQVRDSATGKELEDLPESDVNKEYVLNRLAQDGDLDSSFNKQRANDTILKLQRTTPYYKVTYNLSYCHISSWGVALEVILLDLTHLPATLSFLAKSASLGRCSKDAKELCMQCRGTEPPFAVSLSKESASGVQSVRTAMRCPPLETWLSKTSRTGKHPVQLVDGALEHTRVKRADGPARAGVRHCAVSRKLCTVSSSCRTHLTPLECAGIRRHCVQHTCATSLGLTNRTHNSKHTSVTAATVIATKCNIPKAQRFTQVRGQTPACRAAHTSRRHAQQLPGWPQCTLHCKVGHSQAHTQLNVELLRLLTYCGCLSDWPWLQRVENGTKLACWGQVLTSTRPCITSSLCRVVCA